MSPNPPGKRLPSSRNKVGIYRDNLRAQGLRLMQAWVPDMRTPSLRAAAHSQSLAVAQSVAAAEDQAFIDAVTTRFD